MSRLEDEDDHQEVVEVVECPVVVEGQEVQRLSQMVLMKMLVQKVLLLRMA